MSRVDIRNSLPKGMNTINMKEDGKRSCFLYEYGYPNSGDDGANRTITAICSAWRVVDTFDTDKYEYGKPFKCNRDTSRHFMLKFEDGLWRSASFGGLSGEPMASCDWDGHPGKDGEVAYLNYRVYWQTRHVNSATEKLEAERVKLADLQGKLALALGAK